MTKTQEIPAETGNMKRDFARWIKDTPGQVSLYQAYHAGRIHGDAAARKECAEIARTTIIDGRYNSQHVAHVAGHRIATVIEATIGGGDGDG